MEKKNKIYVERETYEKDGKTYFSYFIKGIIRGKEVKIAVAPQSANATMADRGGYTVFEIVFGNENKLELIATPYEIKDSTGHVMKGKTFSVKSVDENGEVYECQVKPFKSSDKALLNMLVR
jgi:hypothetical protein